MLLTLLWANQRWVGRKCKLPVVWLPVVSDMSDKGDGGEVSMVPTARLEIWPRLHMASTKRKYSVSFSASIVSDICDNYT